ncbi:MAG: type IVB secretion system protein IcmH/DotU [Nitrosomonas sp.]
MNQNDPFASPDLDRTIIMPSPGGRLPPSQRSSYSQMRVPGDTSINFAESLSKTTTGLNPLIAAANPILHTATVLRTTLQRPDLVGLRDYLVQSIQTFENQARAAEVSSEKIIASRYALCTFIDESISSTPWGSEEWGKYSLLIHFHNETVGGEKFFQLLAKLAENPKTNLDILEFIYICLTLGFEGRYRVMNNGKAQLEILRERLAQIINKEHNKFERELSPHWQAAVYKRNKFFLFMPLWILTSLCGLALLTTYLTFSFLLSDASDPVFAQIQSIRTGNAIKHQIPVSQPSVNPYLTEFLAQEINAKLLTVRFQNNQHVITLIGDGLFSPGSIVVSQKFVPVLKRIADALNQRPGHIQILGHTDNRPIRSVQFPSNWHLSQERALSAMQLLVKMGISSNRIHGEGRADAEPIASNDTPEGREKNRRVEIIVD